MEAILGIKKGMTGVFIDGKSIPVTVVDVSKCVISKADEEHVELGFGKRRANRPLGGKYRGLGYVPRFRRVFLTKEIKGKVGDKIEADRFTEGQVVKVVGTSKGKGFAGVMKRWGFSGGPRTHGQSDRERAPGSIGAGTDPGRVVKGKKMGGRMGGERVTREGVKVVEVGDGWLLLKGGVPGNRGGLIVVKSENNESKASK